MVLFLLLFSASGSYGASPAGYSEFYIPGDENILGQVFSDIGAAGGILSTAARHTVINVVAWSPNTTVYFDHWEDGYDFDKNNPSTADETVVLTNRGDSRTFESANIPVNPRGTNTYYDGRDRIYVAGGTVTVTRESWIDSVGTVFQIAWEVYPVRPQMTTYILPFGDDLAGAPRNYLDFRRVFALAQATKDNTVVTFDLNNDGVYGDTVCTSHSNPCTATATQITLNAGEVFLVDRFAALPTTGTASLATGTKIRGSETLQVNYIIGDQTANYEARGFSAFPRGFWDDEYYAPVPTDNGADYPTQIYLYNPQSTDLTVTYDTSSGSGSFVIPAGQTRSFSEMTGGYVPEGSGVYFKGSDAFWGISTIDTQGQTHEWGYSLLPASLLDNEHFLGWGPGSYPAAGGGAADNAGLYISPAQDNTTVYIDTNNDGVPEQTFTLDRFQSQYVYDSADGDLSNTNIWATGPVSMAFGQNPDTSPTAAPAIDLGYTVLPATDFVDRVLTMQKSANPAAVPTAAGSQTTFTLVADTYGYPVDNIAVTDTLPSGWQYVNNSAAITLADKTTISGAAANPTVSGGGLILTWPSSLLQSMAPHQKITLSFTAQTTMVFSTGAVSRNIGEAAGTRTVGGGTQTFVTSDFAFISYGDLQVTKTSGAADPLYPGDQFTYIVTVTNPSASTLTGLAIYDPLPPGISYVAGSSQATGTRSYVQSDNVRDNFGSAVYNNNADGSVNWAGVWVESDAVQNASAGNVLITGGELRLGSTSNIYRQVDLGSATSATLTMDYRTSGNVDNGEWAYVEVASSAAGPWTTVLSFQNDQNGSVNYSIPNGLWSPATTVRFRTTGYDAGEYLYLDNVDIAYTHTVNSSGTSAANDPPAFLAAGDGYYLDAGQTLTLTYNVVVDDPLATGIDHVTNVAYVNSNEVILPAVASVTNLVVNPSVQSSEASGWVWLDADADGVRDVGEPGLSNVTVTLKDQYGATISITATDGVGHYLFAGIEAGSGYYAEVDPGTLPAGLIQSAPAGHTDNRTNPFTLTAGQSFTDANVGYHPAAGTATFGDLVWSDADGNGIRDLGEPGLAGVTAQLWLDVNENGTIDVGTDTLVASVVTAVNGGYLFTGVTATGMQDYIVFVDSTQAALAGFSQTTIDRNVKDVAANSVFTNLDLGFRNTTGTFTITDRIWNDLNGDGQDDGESGIGGVIVDLLDASRNVIATTISDANGYYLFSGVIGSGADYTIRVSDTSSILQDYYGITGKAVAGEAAIDNLGGNLDFTAEPSEPLFGYGLNQSVSGTVFNDLDGNGARDAGERGMSSVTVRLYDDVNSNGLLDGGDTLDATLVTDPNGGYLFSGLADGSYIVSIPSPPAAYVYTTESPDNDPAAGSQRPAVMSGGNNVLNLDFGYQAIILRSMSGTIWEDANASGGIDAGERLFQGVTVEVLDGGVVIETFSSDASGNYSFSGLTTKAYTVRISDALGVLAGYTDVYENDGVLDGAASVDLTGADATGVNFGFRLPGVTLVSLSGFRAYAENGSVRIEWATSYQHNTAGFHLLRRNDETGQYVQINRSILPALLSSPQGAVYSLIDVGASLTKGNTYILVEKENRGQKHAYGPFTVTAGGGNAMENAYNSSPSAAKPSPDSSHEEASAIAGRGSSENTAEVSLAGEVFGYTMKPREISAGKISRLLAAQTSSDKARYLRKLRRGDMAKIAVDQEGLYYLSAGEIASLLGISEEGTKELIRTERLAMRNQGKRVAYLPADGFTGIFFYGEGIDSLYTKENIYWLYKGAGLQMNHLEGNGPSPVGQGAFTGTVHAEEDTRFNNIDVQNSGADYWFWSYLYVVPDFPDYASASFVIRTDSVANIPDTATLTVNLKGYTDSNANPDHHVRVSLNGTVIGEGWLDGTDTASLVIPFDQGLLYDGDNTVGLEALLDTGVPESAFYLDSFDLTYQRLYEANGDSLIFTSEETQPVTVYGFSSPSISVFDVTDARRPMVDDAITVRDEVGSYSVSFTPSAAGNKYLIVTPDAAISGVDAWADRPSRLSSGKNAADYIIIAPDQLHDAAKVLAKYRRGQGYTTRVIHLEDIMDEFNDGISSPTAIRDFLAHAYYHWETAPRYVVLAGDGTYDYRDNTGYGENLVPTMVVSTPYGVFPSDNYFADADGDHVPEMAIGRLPVLTAGELQDLIDKIIAFENVSGSKVLMLADNPDFDGDYPSDSDDVALLVPARFSVEKMYLPERAASDIRDMLLYGITGGTFLINYLGHGNPSTLAEEGLFTLPDIGVMDNPNRLFVLSAMSCNVGEFAAPGFDSLSEALVMKKGGGAVAVVGSSGFSLNSLSKALDEGFFSDLFSHGRRAVLGDSLRKAFKFYKKSGGADFTLDIYNLLGDPALRVRLK
jgi:uncharacterized repeat protein (TIGR01451 family)